MEIIRWIRKKLEAILPPMYGNYERGSFPVKRKLKLSQAKSLILEAGAKNRWKDETDFTYSFLKINYLEKNKNKDLLICDYGIGIGRIALPILRDYPKTKIIGVDDSASMLELAKKWMPGQFFEEKRLKLINPEDFFRKYKDQMFDLIIATYVFQHIFKEELEKLIKVLHKNLKDDGKLFLVNTFQNDDAQGREVRIKELIVPYFEKEKEINPYENRQDYISWMADAGAGYGDWREMENAKMRNQKMMGLYKKK